MPTDIYTSDDTWTCPAGITSVDVECWGGGAGGNGKTSGRGDPAGGQGGGGGAYSKKTITVTPSTDYSVTVGGAGSAGVADGSVAGQGGDSWFSSIGTVFAKGGGTLADCTAGGLAADGIGDVKYSGGNGGTAAVLQAGGGGGGAGTTADGGNASAATAGTGGSADGGNGGTGDVSAGSTIGGGGGGGVSGTGNGYAGARGEVRITYELPGQPITKRFGGVPGMGQSQSFGRQTW